MIPVHVVCCVCTGWLHCIQKVISDAAEERDGERRDRSSECFRLSDESAARLGSSENSSTGR